MEDFFSDLESSPPILRKGHNDARMCGTDIHAEVALRFADFFLSSHQKYGDRSLQFDPRSHALKTVSVVASETPLAFLTRRLPLVAETAILTHRDAEAHIVSSWDDGPPSYGADARARKDYIRCPSLTELGHWLLDCKPLLLSGDIFYYPELRMEVFHENYYMQDGEWKDVDITTNIVTELIVENKKLAEASERLTFDSTFVKAVLQVELPYIENVDLITFSKITSDESDALQSFRSFLRSKFIELQKADGNNYFETELVKIGWDIRDGIRKLDSDLVSIRRKPAFQATGATILTTTAVLLAVNSIAFGHLAQIVGSGGGLMLAINAIHEYLSNRKQVQESPFYYFWLFENSIPS
jgi:hypothetical protein